MAATFAEVPRGRRRVKKSRTEKRKKKRDEQGNVLGSSLELGGDKSTWGVGESAPYEESKNRGGLKESEILTMMYTSRTGGGRDMPKGTLV